MTEEALRALVEQIRKNHYESQTIEVKSASRGAPKLYETLSSFSNQNAGGTIVFGLSETKDFEIVGVYDAQKLQKSIFEQCQEMEPPVRPEIAVAEIDGAIVMSAFIPGRTLAERPVYRRTAGLTQGSFIRVGDADLHMSATELYEIDAFKHGRRDDVSTLEMSSVEMLDDERVDSFIKSARKDRPQLERRERFEMLSLLGMVRSGRPTLAGMYCLSAYPQQSYPNLCVTAVSVSGKDFSGNEAPERFADTKRFEGPINEMIEASLAFIKRNTKTRILIHEGKRKDFPEYPENALREIISNALIHRDYGPYCNGTPVRISIFSDRLECWNPGGIYGGQDIEDLGRINMQTRNPTLISALEILGVVENRHSGIPTIRDEMNTAGLRPPVFISRQGGFKVILYNDADTFCEEAHGAAKRLWEEAPDLMDFLSTPRTRAEIGKMLNKNAEYASRNIIAPLVREGKLKMTLPDKPRSKNQRYYRAEQ